MNKLLFMGFKSFMTEPRTMNGSIGVGTTKGTEKQHIIDGIPNILHNTVDGTVGTLAKYAKDVINPAWDGLKSGMNVFNPKAIADNGGFWKNTGKSLSGMVTREASAVKNAVGGIIGGIGHTYRRGVQDNIHDILSSTTDHVPYVGPGFGNSIRFMSMLPQLAGKIPMAILKGIDIPFDVSNEFTARTGKEAPKNILRV